MSKQATGDADDFVTIKVSTEKIQRYQDRQTWKNSIETFLTPLGAVIGLGNIWRFPYITYQYGGGAFLIPYFIFVASCGFPMFFLETSLGQYTRQGALQSWNMVPILKGVGLGSGVMCFLSNIYYIIVMSWGVCYFAQTLRFSDLPWMKCDNWYNTNSCLTYETAMSQNITTFAEGNNTLPIFEFWNHYILRKSDGLDDLGGLDNVPMILSLLASWIMVYFCIFRGTKSTGKVVYFSSIFPYIMLIILLVKGCTLPGSSSGIYYYLKPNMTELLRPEVWVYAGSQVFYSFAICITVSVTFGSFSKFNSDCYKRTFYLSLACSLTSFIGGFAVFAVLGNMAQVLHMEVKDVVKSGPGLAFITYPTALSLMPIPQFWNACFFLMIITIAVDSQFSGTEGLLTMFYDYFDWPRKNRELFSGLFCLFFFLCGLIFVTPGGVYVFEIFNSYAVSGICLLWLVAWQSIGIGWVYGATKYYEIIKEMIGYYPSIYLSLCFQFFTPVLSLAVILFFILDYKPLTDLSYTYPGWANGIGWLLSMSSIICVPGWAIYEVYCRQGTIYERIKDACKPKISVPTELPEDVLEYKENKL